MMLNIISYQKVPRRGNAIILANYKVLQLMLQVQFRQKTLLLQFEIKQKSFKNILTIPLNDKSTSLQIEVNSNATIITYLGCLLDQDFIPFYESNSFLQNEISTGMLKFSKDEIKQCQDNKNQMESMLGYKLDNYMIFLLVNDQNQKAQVELKLQIMIDEDKGSGLEIYYILAGAIGSLIFALLLILCVIYLQRKARKINIGTQNNQNLRLNSLKEIINRNLKQDQIPVELYEQIIQEYPGLIEISDCQICLVEFQKQDLVKLTYCLHLFHSICIDEWRKRNQTCPFCREDLTKQKCIQQRHEEQIYQLGVISGEAMQIDEQKLAEFQRREQRLKQQQQTSSPDSANGLQLKESTPSPFLKKDLINQQLCLQIKK
ncbi:unnamed protein product [Paramecium sonneborni]|uniref:RING-type domain-containing protein n=1 Tax=Paramecium sonneborni TaxID=65129 RepID=A0A8S1KZW0_9CILI|nr:unnamed protein product [Paramecium sonneborni]